VVTGTNPYSRLTRNTDFFRSQPQVRKEDTTFGLPTDPGREISRDTVAAVCVEALFASSASNKVVEIVASLDAPATKPDTWFD
jgi:hypothetical protein